MTLLSLKPQNLKRYKDVVRLIVKYGRADLFRSGDLADLDEETAAEAASPRAEELAADLERLGPTFIKLGQLLSTRADLLPLPYLEALARLQDRVEPFPYAEVEQIVCGELGVRISKAFSEFNPVPIAAASLGQVHRAKLRDGREVAVKVQRPAIRERIVEDLEAMEEVAGLLDRHTEAGARYEFGPMLDQFRKSLMNELDYRLEAANLTALGTNLADFERIVVPSPVADYTTSRVLTMDYIRGRKVTKLSPLARIELDGAALAEQLFAAYLRQILVDGLFHADPHPGNVFITDDGRLALIDLGMVCRIAPGLQEDLLKLLLAVSEGRGEEVARLTIKMGRVRDGFVEPEFRRSLAELVARHQGATVADIEVGRVVLEVSHAAGEGGVLLPPELALLGKTLLNLDEVSRTLDPALDPNASIRRHAAELMSRRMWKSATPGNLFNALIEAKEFAENLPGRVNRILEVVANNELRLNVDAIDEERLMEGFQKVANRITMGLILAALIVGAAMLMRVETPFRLFGYPGLAMVLFLAAVGGGFGLVFNILFHDVKPNKRIR